MAFLEVQGGAAAEGDSVVFSVLLSQPVLEIVTVRYRTVQGTAESDEDYSRIGISTLAFQPGETSKTISVRSSTFDSAELDESVILEIFDPVNADLPEGATISRSTGWILDTDSVSNTRALYVSNPEVIEGDDGTSVARFAISFSQPLTSNVAIAYTTLDGTAKVGRDYIATSGIANLFSGQTETVVEVPVLANRRSEPNEDFYLAISPPSGFASGPFGSTGRARIHDDDGAGGPSISVEGAVASEGNPLYYTVNLSEASSETTTVLYRPIVGVGRGTATPGTDFGSFGTTVLTFFPGETSKNIRVNTSTFDAAELDESVALEFFAPVNANLEGEALSIQATGWIWDTDSTLSTRTVFVSSPLLAEQKAGRQAQAKFVVELSRPSAQDITLNYLTVDGTAVAGADYIAESGSVTIRAGQTSATIFVDVLSDLSFESAETFLLRLLPPFPSSVSVGSTGAFATATVQDSSIVGLGFDDVLVGTTLGDLIFGEGGNDWLRGLDGDDLLFGGNGDDRLDGGDGVDRLVGGPGNDLYYLDNGRDRASEARGEGDDTVRASVDHKLANHVETLILTGDDAIDGRGSRFDNVLRGNDKANVLDGGRGDDRLFGGGGRDVLIGGLGTDRMAGDGGADSFVFLSERDSRPGRRSDAILDFTGRDEIDLSAIDANVNRARDQRFDYIGRAAFSEAAGELRFRNELLEADTDGDGRADFAVLLEGVSRLSASDLVL